MSLDPIALLAGMLALPSPSGEEAPLVSHLVATLPDHGFRTRRDEAGNLVAEVGDGPRTHLLLGHIDTVPGAIPVRREGSTLWGRGACDAKGPLAAFLTAAARTGAVPGHRVVVIGAVEEEAPSSKGAKHVRTRWRPENTVIGEPSGSSGLTLAYKGRLLAHLACSRPKAHSSVPVATPAERLAALWTRVRDAALSRHGGEGSVFASLQASLDRFHTASNPFAESARATLGFRIPPGLKVDEVKDLVRSAAAGAGSDVAGAGTGAGEQGAGERSAIAVEFEGESEAFRAGKDTSVVRAFLAAMRELGLKPSFKLKTGTSDMNVVGPEFGPSIVAYGPGDSALDHTPEERIEVPELERGVEVLTRVLRRLTGA